MDIKPFTLDQFFNAGEGLVETKETMFNKGIDYHRVALECISEDDNGENGFESCFIGIARFPDYETFETRLNACAEWIDNKARELCSDQNRPSGIYTIVCSNAQSRELGLHVCEKQFEYIKKD